MVRTFADEADVVIVGAGPGGAATAHYLSQYGLRVILLDKATFPRDKICGDGLTPRAVAELIRMGVNTDGWIKNYSLVAHGGGRRVEMPWPELNSMPAYGMARARSDLDETLVRHAEKSGAIFRDGMTVTGPIRHERTGRIIGVEARPKGQDRDAPPLRFGAPVVVDAGGVSARLAIADGREKAMNRPMGVAVRTYFKSPRADEPIMESHLELWSGQPGASELMPGYGWVFPLGEGMVNVGLGSLSSTAKPTGIDYRALFDTWMKNVPAEWGFTTENQVGPVRGAALPMAFNRKPHYDHGLLLVGDAGGMVSPFNGEGIAYAMQSGRIAADYIAQALGRSTLGAQDRVLRQYERELAEELGGYYTLGRVFASLIERPEIMRICVHHGLPRPALMRLVMKLLSDCYDRRGGDWMDRLITALTKVVPKA